MPVFVHLVTAPGGARLVTCDPKDHAALPGTSFFTGESVHRCTGAPVYRCTYMDKIIGQNHSENVPVPVLHFHKQYDHKYRCVLHMKCRAQLAVVKLLGTKDVLI